MLSSAPALLADAAARSRRRALHEYMNSGSGGNEHVMALLWLAAVLALAVIVLVIFERRRRHRHKPDPKKLDHDLFGIQGVQAAQQELLRQIARVGGVDQPSLLLFSRPTFEAAVSRYVGAARTDEELQRRRRRCALLADRLYPDAADASDRGAGAPGVSRPAPREQGAPVRAAGKR
jgi:hypothetical protein